jgi:hypothetical protein
MRCDILPLCDKHYRAMERATAPFSADYSIDYFRCTAQFCHRCFSERLGYVTPLWGQPPQFIPQQPRCGYHSRPMFISGLDRQRNLIHYACPEENCRETATGIIERGGQIRSQR